MTLSEQDRRQLDAHGIREAQVEKQLEQIARGFPFLQLERAASVGRGIVAPSEEARESYVRRW